MPVIHLDRDKEAEVSRQQLLDAIATMPAPELDKFIEDLMTARAQRYAPTLSAAESPLFEQINRCSLGQTDLQRLNELLKRQHAEEITETERSELLPLIDNMEELNVKRIEALAELAKLRGVSLDQLMADLDIKPPGYV